MLILVKESYSDSTDIKQHRFQSKEHYQEKESYFIIIKGPINKTQAPIIYAYKAATKEFHIQDTKPDRTYRSNGQIYKYSWRYQDLSQ